MRTLATIFLVLVATTAATAAEPDREPNDIGLFSYPGDGRKISVFITSEKLAKTPVWPAASEHPPVSPRQALKLGQATFKKIIAKPEEWKLERIALEHSGNERHWYYIVEYRQLGSWGGRPPYVEIVVLMDGTVAEYKVEKDH